MMKEEERLLIEQARLGTAGAYEKLYEQYYHLVFYFAWNLSKNEADARDITQDVFLQVYKSLPELRDVDMFIAWIRKITISKSQSMFRKQRDRVYDPDQIAMRLGKEQRKEFVPHAHMDQLTDKEILEGLILQLPKRRREVLDLFYFQQYSMEEIAQELQVKVGTVKSRLHSARKALLKKVSEFEQMEGRKISFQLDAIVPVFSFALLMNLKKRLPHQGCLNILNATAITTCVITGTVAVKETYDTYQHTSQNTEIVQSTEKVRKSSLKDVVEFSPVSYHNIVVSSTNDAYFVLMEFASDPELLKEKSKEELKEVQSVVQELINSDNAYKDVLEQNGWFSIYQSLI